MSGVQIRVAVAVNVHVKAYVNVHGIEPSADIVERRPEAYTTGRRRNVAVLP